MKEPDFQYEFDATGLFCPEPVMMLHNKIREMQLGEVLKVTATDPSTERDIPKFCVFLGHPLLLQTIQEDKTGSLYIYWIQKQGAE